MDVSVIVPTRNRSALLAITLRSALRQRDVDFEIIVVDEASSDGTQDVIAGLSDSRIRVIRHDTPLGVSAARNRGVAEARAEWVAFLDDDDVWAPDKLSLQLRAAHESGRLWVYVGHVNINRRHRVTGGSPPVTPDTLLLKLPQSNVVPGGCSGVIASKRALERTGLFDVHLQPLADWDLWLRLSRVCPPACVPRPLVAYRLHGQQMSLDAPRLEAEFRILSARYGQPNEAVHHRYVGWWALRVRNHRQALSSFVRAWLQRRPEYRLRTFASDLAALGRDVVEQRLGLRLPQLAPFRQVSDEHQSWRSEGQAWVDALLTDCTGPQEFR